MNLKLLYLLMSVVLAAFFTLPVKGQQQQVLGVTGGNLHGDQVSISYTIGEETIKTLVGQTLVLTQGFHQPKLFVTAIDDLTDVSVNISAYPNPVIDVIYLESSKILAPESSFEIYSINGSLVQKGKLEGQLTQIPFESRVSSTYILHVHNGSRTLKKFKIVKK